MTTKGFESLWGKLEALGRSMQEVRAPGATRVSVVERLGERVRDDVVEWFSRCNGVLVAPGQTQDDACIIPGYEPLSLDEALTFKEGYKHIDDEIGGDWIPILRSGGGDFYAVMLSGRSRHVVDVMVEEGATPAYENLECMVAAFLEAYTRGAYFAGEDGTLEVDDALSDQDVRSSCARG